MNKYITKWQQFLVFIKMIPLRYRASMGFCPSCNSDAPEVDDCPICDSWRGSFPPTKELRRKWLKDCEGAKEIKYQIDNAIQQARKNRLSGGSK